MKDSENQKFYSKFVNQKGKKEQIRSEKRKARQEFEEFRNSRRQSSFQSTDYRRRTDGEITACTKLFSNGKLDSAAQKTLQDFDEVLQGVQPLNSRQLQTLPENIRELSHQLTDMRSERRLGYMNENVKLSAYARYFLWWNLVRLTTLFSNLGTEAFPDLQDASTKEPSDAASSIVCLDLGSGPLTVVSALWLSRPDLRNLPMVWYCLDLSQNALSLGEDIYYSIAAKNPPSDKKVAAHWQIIRIKGSFGTTIKQKAHFITEANMFNELDQGAELPPEAQVKKYFEQLKTYSAQNAKYLLIEPGVPKAARTLSLMRDRFLKTGSQITAPCPHSELCPMNGFKAYTGSENKWCNLAFSTEDAPAKLKKLSDSAKLPKERAVLSFISVNSKNTNSEKAAEKKSDKKELSVRIISDAFRLPKNLLGNYACSKYGLTLISTKAQPENPPPETATKKASAKKHTNAKPAELTAKLFSGDLISVKIKTPEASLQKDEKSGAIKIEL